ncbi:hypothetical protein GCM10023189_22110 [Nibrella saemangeumensis]|uniref:Uncharacterized protein n=1 Tax=Nibrella saemangeumensis TaxID=1084526 RepID=A0ABP8MT22_9BACT
MRNFAQKDWRLSRSAKKSSVDMDQTTALGGLSLALFGYILYHFIYPLIEKGLIF